MHKVHHHHTLPHTDSNFGNIFSVWDRLFGTFRTIDDAALVYGIDTHPDPRECDSVRALLLLPFGRKRSSEPSKSAAPAVRR
jgi:hypothetical protein